MRSVLKWAVSIAAVYGLLFVYLRAGRRVDHAYAEGCQAAATQLCLVMSLCEINDRAQIMKEMLDYCYAAYEKNQADSD